MSTMKGGQPIFKMLTTLKRAKVYFIIIALTMTVTLFFLSYGWSISGKTYKIHTTRVTLSSRVIANSTRLNKEANKRRTNTRFSLKNNTSHIFTTFLDSRSSDSKATSYDNLEKPELLKHKQLNKTALIGDNMISRNTSNESIQLSDNKSFTDHVRQKTISDLAKTVNTQGNTILTSTDLEVDNRKPITSSTRRKSASGGNITKPANTDEAKKFLSKQSSISVSRTHANDKAVISNSAREVLNRTSNSRFTVTTPEDNEYSTLPFVKRDPDLENTEIHSVNADQTKQTSNISTYPSNTTKPKSIYVTSENKIIQSDNETSIETFRYDSDLSHQDKRERHTNESNGTLTDHQENQFDRKSVANFTLTTQLKHNSSHLESDFQTDHSKHTKLRTDKQRARTRDSHRYETIGLRHKPKYSVLDQLKYGIWNPGDRNRVSANKRGGNHPTVRPDGCQGCFKTDFKLLINAKNICKKNENVSAMVFIASAPQNKLARDVIRRTWGEICYEPSSTIKCVFVFGEHRDEKINTDLASESKLHQDIIQFGFRDAYANLTYKTMMSLKWASENCQTANYIMKTDDDMYVNTELMPLFLQGAPNSKFFGGFCWGPSSPHRDTNSKWYVSYEQFAQPLYPTMCSGTGYLMTRDVLLDVLNQSRDVPFFYLEDVYVSLCLKKGGIQPVLMTGFSNMKVEYEACAFRNKVITSHGHTPYELDFIWTGIHGCAREENLTPEMVYNPKYLR